ncbi:30S ribosomal protein S3 [Candidatus Woesearchaeota archaeon]|nr:30S ribosomal protein S3 [Candidatus Woesearchaeota archaeon]
MERNFVAEKLKEFQIEEFVSKRLNRVGHSHTVMKKTPLGEKIIIHASRPGLVVGRQGGNIKELTKQLKKEFNLENPQIEIQEVENIFLDPEIVAERIANSLERFGTTRFKGVGHKMMEKVLEAGALGIEIIMSGKIPGARARSWRFYQGYLKKCGDMAMMGVRKSCKTALLKTGIIGIRVRIMPPELKEQEEIKLKKEEEIIEEIKEEPKKEKKEVKKKKPRKKKETKKTEKRVEEKKEEVVEEKPKEEIKEEKPKAEEPQEAKKEQ